MQTEKSFKEHNSLEQRIKMYEKGKSEKPDCIVVIVEKDPKCKSLPTLKHHKFSIKENQKVLQIEGAIRSRILTIDEKFKNQPFFMFTGRKMPSKERTIKEIYDAYKDPEDHLLYFKYSNVDPYGFAG